MSEPEQLILTLELVFIMKDKVKLLTKTKN